MMPFSPRVIFFPSVISAVSAWPLPSRRTPIPLLMRRISRCKQPDHRLRHVSRNERTPLRGKLARKFLWSAAALAVLIYLCLSGLPAARRFHTLLLDYFRWQGFLPRSRGGCAPSRFFCG